MIYNEAAFKYSFEIKKIFQAYYSIEMCENVIISMKWFPVCYWGEK